MSTKVIAEIGWNHMGDMKLAAEMIKESSDSGASFAKFQTWKVSRLKSGAWDFDGRREIYENAELSEKDHEYLIEICNKNKIEFLSSAFALEDAKLLKYLGCKKVKIPSFECTNRELINYCQNNFSEVIISTGTATKDEIDNLKLFINQEKTIVMHCVSSYPCTSSIANLPRLNYLKENFLRVGYSDHTQGINVACISLNYQVEFIEKHFTINNDLPGRDNKFAILPNEMKNLNEFIDIFSNANKFHGIDFQPEETQESKSFIYKLHKL